MPFSLLLSNLPNASFLINFLGFSATSWSGVPLPFDLAGLGLPGCSLYVSLDIGFGLGTGNGTVIWGSVIPSMPEIYGLEFFNQGYVFDPGIPVGVSTTNAGRGSIGW